MISSEAVIPFAEITEELRHLEHSLWIAETRYDRAWVDALFAEDFMEFGRSGGRYTRAECLEVEPKQRIDVLLPLPDFVVSPLDQNNFLVTYISIHQGSSPGKANRASIWTRMSDGWKLRFHQGTPTI
jgi:hypothetical protein